MIATETARATINIYNSDCMEAMKGMADNQYDLAIVDPPFGLKDRMQGSKLMGRMSKEIDWNENIPSKQYFQKLLKISKNQIIWGANYYANYLPNERDWLVWDKNQPIGIGYSMHELAWTSFSKVPKIIKYTVERHNRRHPCQKPVALYKWLLQNYAKEGDKILDTHGGSMSHAIACWDLKFDLDIYEIDKDYYEAGRDRFNNHCKQGQLF